MGMAQPLEVIVAVVAPLSPRQDMINVRARLVAAIGPGTDRVAGEDALACLSPGWAGVAASGRIGSLDILACPSLSALLNGMLKTAAIVEGEAWAARMSAGSPGCGGAQANTTKSSWRCTI